MDNMTVQVIKIPLAMTSNALTSTNAEKVSANVIPMLNAEMDTISRKKTTVPLNVLILINAM